MTIKQLGGVFGRNPTFNDAEVEGDLIVDGSIGIGTDSPGAEIEIRSLSPEVRFVDNAGPESTGKITYLDGRLVIQSDDTDQIGSSTIEFQVDNAEAARFNSSGNLAFPSGQGIDFSATAGTGTSELLDDYEEGTWTPNYTAATGGNLGGTQSRQGYYTKVGNKVTVQFYLYINTIDVTGKSGDVTVTGLPFTGSLGGNATGSLVVTEDTGQYGAFTNSPRTMKLSGSGDSLVLLKEISSNVEQPLQVTDFATGGGNRNIIRASFTYIV